MFLSQTNGPALYYYGFDPTKSIEHLSKAGFRYCDISFFTVFKTCPIYFSDDYMKVVEEYKEALKRYNMTPVQSHEPAGNSIGDDNGEYYMKKTPRSIEMAAKIGCRSITIHPGTANKYALTREEFVEKNREFYDAKASVYDKFGENSKENRGTNLNQLDNTVNRFGRLEDIKKQLEKLNAMTENRRGYPTGSLLMAWQAIKHSIVQGRNIRQATIEKLDNLFRQYQEGVEKLRDIAQYYDTARNQMNRQHLEKIVQAIKYAKGPSIEKRKYEILDFLKERGYGKGYIRSKLYDVCMWEAKNFQIKNFDNGTRLGLKNLFAFDEEKLRQEINSIKQSVLVIFDDNISGGATLSDICYQFKKLGIENIIPITFGKMKVKNMMGTSLPNYKFNMN